MTFICFDLDGTLLDPLEGVEHCLRLACADAGVHCPDRAAIAARIGLDLGALFQDLPVSRSRELLSRYDRCFAGDGFARLRIQEGVQAPLSRLKRQGHRLFAAASLPEPLLRKILHHFDLLLAFDGVAGLRPGETWKPKVELLERLRLDGYLLAGGLLVGDRADDMRAARTLALEALGVTYGYGSRRELAEAQASILVDSVRELDARLEESLKAPEIHDPFTRSE